MTLTKTQIGLASALLVASSVASFDSKAIQVLRGDVSTAAGLCQPAFGASETAIRKRPLSVQNEGTTNAFVSCAFTAPFAPTVAQLWLNSADGLAHLVSCTGISGYNTNDPIYVVKSTTVGPGDGQEPISFLPADFGGTADFGSEYFSTSCSLPPGAGINDVYIAYPQDVGA